MNSNTGLSIGRSFASKITNRLEIKIDKPLVPRKIISMESIKILITRIVINTSIRFNEIAAKIPIEIIRLNPNRDTKKESKNMTKRLIRNNNTNCLNI